MGPFFEIFFKMYARRSGQILCSEPDGPPVELQVGPHDWSKDQPEANTTCPKCRAVV